MFKVNIENILFTFTFKLSFSKIINNILFYMTKYYVILFKNVIDLCYSLQTMLDM